MSSQKLLLLLLPLPSHGLSLENHWSRPSGHWRSFQPFSKMLMIILLIYLLRIFFRWGLM